MQRYQPYLIGNLRTGLEEGLEPWLLPQDAWASMSNCYLRRGVLIKRDGYVQFDRFIHAVDDEAIGSSGSTNYAGTLANIPIRAGDLSFTDGTLTITDDGDGTLSGDVGAASTINYTTGAYDVTFSGTTTGAVTADYDYYPGNSIVGVLNYSNTSANTTDLMIFDKKRCCEYDETNEKLESVTAADTWTGGDYDLFHGCNSRERLYVANNTDRVKYWDSSSFTNLLMDIDNDGDNDVDTCKLIFSYKERIVVFRTTENGVLYPQRARWNKTTNHDDWTNDGYVDAPTEEWIMSAGFIGDDLIVWFQNSTWRFKYTSNADLPFRWEKIDSNYGSYSSFSSFTHKDVMGVVGQTSINETDSLRSYQIDGKIPDAVDGFDASNFDNIYAIQVKELGQIIISYTPIDQTENTASLCFNYDDGAWSRHDYGFNCYGYFKQGESGLTLDEIEETFDELEISFDENTRQAGYPVVLGGDSSGYIWKINYGADDNGSAIDFEVFSGRWNPWLRSGKKARFGWLNLLVGRDDEIDLEVSFYTNRETVAHTTATVTCEEYVGDVVVGGGAPKGKVWVRADNGAIGDFHRVKISNNASGETVKIYAMIAYMKPAGYIR